MNIPGGIRPADWQVLRQTSHQKAQQHIPMLWRKGSFGTDSEQGSRFVERILTVVTTLRMQQRNVLD